MKTGLVLGAGGIVGQAYEAGVLAAFEEAGFDARGAGVVVGSSAGSVTGSLLRLGLSAGDLAAWAAEQVDEVSPQGADLLEVLGAELPDLPAPQVRDLLHGWRLPSRRLLARAARRPWAFRPGVAALTMLPSGKVDICERARVLDRGGWPDDLWICAARRSDGKRVVLGREGSPDALLSDAVAASCAIPGYLAPVRIGRTEYIDGGVHSSTNADVLAGSGLDVVLVVAPMSAHGVVSGADAPVRWSTRRRLDREVARLKAAGAQVIRVEPTRRVLGAMGYNAMADDRSDRVVDAAYHQAKALLRRPGLAVRLDMLRAGLPAAPAAA